MLFSAHRRRLLPWLVVAMMLACTSTQGVGDRFFDKGRYLEAAAAFESYLSSEPKDADRVARTMFRLGLLQAMPDSPAYAPERAVETFDRLLSTPAGRRYSVEAGLIRDLQLEVIDLERKVAGDQDRIEGLRHQLARLQTPTNQVAEPVESSGQEVREYQAQIRSLRAEIARLSDEIAAREDELSRLKAIDLEKPP